MLKIYLPITIEALFLHFVFFFQAYEENEKRNKLRGYGFYPSARVRTTEEESKAQSRQRAGGKLTPSSLHQKRRAPVRRKKVGAPPPIRPRGKGKKG